MRLDMAVEVEAHETGQLHEARIDAPHEAGVIDRHARDHMLLEPGHGVLHRHLVHFVLQPKKHFYIRPALMFQEL